MQILVRNFREHSMSIIAKSDQRKDITGLIYIYIKNISLNLIDLRERLSNYIHTILERKQNAHGILCFFTPFTGNNHSIQIKQNY